MPKLNYDIENDDVRRVWNYVLPQQHKSTSASPIQSIPLLYKQDYSQKGKIKNQGIIEPNCEH